LNILSLRAAVVVVIWMAVVEPRVDSVPGQGLALPPELTTRLLSALAAMDQAPPREALLVMIRYLARLLLLAAVVAAHIHCLRIQQYPQVATVVRAVAVESRKPPMAAVLEALETRLLLAHRRVIMAVRDLLPVRLPLMV
jgi:hypothetical protein